MSGDRAFHRRANCGSQLLIGLFKTHQPRPPREGKLRPGEEIRENELEDDPGQRALEVRQVPMLVELENRLLQRDKIFMRQARMPALSVFPAAT